MKPCKNCGQEISDAAEALFDGENWFCDYKCHDQFLAAQIAAREASGEATA